MIEVELYRRLAERTVGRTIDRVHAPDAWYLKRGLTARAAGRALSGRRLERARRRGKQLLVDTDGPVLGLHLGMSGRVISPRDPLWLAGALETLLVNPDLREGMARRARNKIEERFSASRNAWRLAKLFFEAVAKKRLLT